MRTTRGPRRWSWSAAASTATVVREALAGEDDDEDHPWAVVTDAPMIQLEMLVETYDGWLDLDEETPAAPLPLPDQPKRIKRRPD